jgi:hypothetical protein
VTGRRRRRRMKPLDDLNERTGYSHLKEEALNRTMWRAPFGRGFRPVVRQTAKCNGVLFHLLYMAVSLIFLYVFTDYCHRVETQLQ